MVNQTLGSLKLAVCSATLGHLDRQALLDFLAGESIRHLELGVGGYPGTQHVAAADLCADPATRRWWQAETQARVIHIGALACHGNPFHPNENLARRFHEDFLAALEAANALEIPVVVGFSGQPGTGASPNWPVIAWPYEYAELYERQWREQLIPYWQAMSARAAALGVRIALEMHGGFAVHAPSTLLRLREQCGPALGANFDPSHLWWQQIEPAAAVQILGDAIFHFHLKDTSFNQEALNRHGVLDMTPHNRPFERAWHFSVPGDGHGASIWRNLIGELLKQGYAGLFSVEHEAPMPVEDGIRRCLSFMRSLA